MARRKWQRLSSTERRELWERWKRGQSLSDIARALEKRPSSIEGVLRRSGGVAPPARRRSVRALSASEREAISRGLAAGGSIRSIAGSIGRAPSTVSREIARNAGRKRYRACEADRQAWKRARRPKRCRLARHGRLRTLVAHKLRQQWSPEQISGWLRLRYPGEATMQISHETIYRSLFVQARGVLKKELVQHLRTRRGLRRSRHATTKGQGRGSIADAVSIRERPASVEDRAVPGHWEGDLLAGSLGTQIATLVERQSRFTLLVKLESKDAPLVAHALAKGIKKLPAQLRKSLTWDRGSELAAHQQLSLAAEIDVYFCDPQSPWQRGTNENTNGLLRQYFPKGQDISGYSQADLNQVAARLNGRPRETLGFRTPAEVLNEALR